MRRFLVLLAGIIPRVARVAKPKNIKSKRSSLPEATEETSQGSDRTLVVLDQGCTNADGSLQEPIPCAEQRCAVLNDDSSSCSSGESASSSESDASSTTLDSESDCHSVSEDSYEEAHWDRSNHQNYSDDDSVSLADSLEIYGFDPDEFFLDSEHGSNPGCSERAMDALPTNVVESEDNLPTNACTCSICLEDYKKGDMRMVLPCSHGFHESCIRTWLAKTDACPLCKHPITQTVLSSCVDSEDEDEGFPFEPFCS